MMLGTTNIKFPDDGCITETCRSDFNIDFYVSFETPLEQSNCAISWINKKDLTASRCAVQLWKIY